MAGEGGDRFAISRERLRALSRACFERFGRGLPSGVLFEEESDSEAEGWVIEFEELFDELIEGIIWGIIWWIIWRGIDELFEGELLNYLKRSYLKGLFEELFKEELFEGEIWRGISL